MEIINTEVPKEFKAFDVTLKIQSEDEARLLFHVFNRGGLTDQIFTASYSGTFYVKPSIKEFNGVYADFRKLCDKNGVQITQ